MAITDHDGMYGVAQFAQAAARQAEQTGTPLRTVFGAELSLGCVDPGGRPPGTPRLPAVVPAAHRPLARAGGPGLAGPVRNLVRIPHGWPTGTPIRRGSICWCWRVMRRATGGCAR